MKPISIDSVTHAYRLYAPLYDWLFGAVLEPGRRTLAEAVSALQPRSLLEIGVGTGLLLQRYPRTSAICGIDVSPEMLNIARRRTDRLGHQNIKLSVMNAESMDFDDNQFDCVTLPYVLSVTPNPDALVAEARRVCRKGGTIFVLNHFSGSRFWWFLEQAVRSVANKVGFRSSFAYDEQILKHDWQVVSVNAVNLFDLSKLVVIRNT